ncbi:MAG TPA: hypothetical protein VIV60_14480 [Polyangiaceae bacterium]
MTRSFLAVERSIVVDGVGLGTWVQQATGAPSLAANWQHLSAAAAAITNGLGATHPETRTTAARPTGRDDLLVLTAPRARGLARMSASATPRALRHQIAKHNLSGRRGTIVLTAAAPARLDKTNQQHQTVASQQSRKHQSASPDREGGAKSWQRFDRHDR